MENMAQGLEQNVADVASTPSESNDTSRSDERVFRQSELNEIVGRAKHEAIESYKRRQEQQAQPQKQYQSTDDSNDFRRIAAEEAQRLRDEWIQEARQKSETEYAQKIVDTYTRKVEADKAKYADFDQIAGNIKIEKFPNVVHLLAEAVDNAGDVLYELGKNRLGLSQLEMLANISPEDALEHVKRLSKSIKENEDAAKARVANAPLSQLRPTNNSADAGSPLSVSDYRKIYRV